MDIKHIDLAYLDLEIKTELGVETESVFSGDAIKIYVNKVDECNLFFKTLIKPIDDVEVVIIIGFKKGSRLRYKTITEIKDLVGRYLRSFFMIKRRENENT